MASPRARALRVGASRGARRRRQSRCARRGVVGVDRGVVVVGGGGARVMPRVMARVQLSMHVL